MPHVIMGSGSRIPEPDVATPDRQCDNCPKTLLPEGGVTAPCGGTLCAACHEAAVTTCECCRGDRYRASLLEVIRSDGVGGRLEVCEDCRWECNGCGEEFYSNDNDGYCLECHDERYFICDGCGYSRRRDTEINAHCGELLCNSCYDTTEEEDRSPLHDHDYTPRLTFFGEASAEDEPQSGCPYFGVELEMELPTDVSHDDDEFAELVYSITSSGFWYVKRDGSLEDGMECVSHPATIQRWRKQDLGWTDKARKMGYRSYDTRTCGMHVHISRSSLSDWEWYKMACLFRDSDPLINRAARRYIGRWASNSLYDTSSDVVYKIKRKGGFERYRALNFMPKHTAEVRIFQGTLDKRAVGRNIEMVNAMYHFTKGYGLSDMKEVPFLDWLKGGAGLIIGHPQARSLTKWLDKR